MLINSQPLSWAWNLVQEQDVNSIFNGTLITKKGKRMLSQEEAHAL
jgi:hypothetical protein